MAIAESIVDVVQREAKGRPVRKIGVIVGHLRQVVPSALAFNFDLVTTGTIAEGAELELEHVPAAGLCGDCGEETEMGSFPLACGACGCVDVEIVRGEELRVDWLELEEPAPAPTTE